MASVTVDDVRDVININSADVPDTKISKMMKRAEVTLELELGKEIDYQNCTDAEKEFITVLAATYAICYLTDGSAVGLNTQTLLYLQLQHQTHSKPTTPLPAQQSTNKHKHIWLQIEGPTPVARTHKNN
jgi:hypothetical protein